MQQYQPYLDFIASQFEHMKQLTYNWSKINSGSYNLAGLEQMRVALRDNFYWLGVEIEEIELPPAQNINAKGEIVEISLGVALRMRKRPEANIQVFLGGHYDTVFDTAHHFQTPILLNDNVINGPGVADLKGGLVVMLKALEALERSPFAENIGYEILLNPDEEIGSVGSDFLLKVAANRNQIGLIYEPSLPDGTLVSERKGSGNFSIIVRGKAAHAGREHHLGRNAVVHAAKIAVHLSELSNGGLTVNVAKIEGGGALNVVPDLAIIRFNVRVIDLTQQHFMLEKLQQIINDFADEDYKIELHGGFTRPAKVLNERHQHLWKAVSSTGEMLGLELKSKPSGGCCDGNNLSAYGLPNIDTLGVRGGNIHSDQEYILLDSLIERAQLSALLLMRIASGEIEI
jgi:glutamate carboxypeptidase